MRLIAFILPVFILVSCMQVEKKETNNTCYDSLSRTSEHELIRKFGFIFPVNERYSHFDFIPFKEFDLNNYFENFFQENIDTGFQIDAMMLKINDINHIASAMDTIFNKANSSDFIELLPIYLEYTTDCQDKELINSYKECINGVDLLFNIRFLSSKYEIKKIIPLKSYTYIQLIDTTIVRR
jgi:hypothetical protein